MLDIAYVALTMLFFALMLVYVRGCDALGRRQEGEDRTPWRSIPSSAASPPWWSSCTCSTRCSDRRSS